MKIRIALFFVLCFIFIAQHSLSQDKNQSSSPTGNSNNFYRLADTVLAAQYFAKGDSLSNKTQYDSSNFYLENAKEIYEKICSNYNIKTNWINLIKCYNDKSDNLISVTKIDSAIAIQKKTLKIGLRELGENNIEVAKSFSILGTAYWQKGDYEQSLANHKKALAIKLKLLGENQTTISSSYNSMGLVYEKKSDYDEALENFQKALSILIKIFGEQHPYVSLVYNNIGGVYWFKNDFDKSLEYYQKALAIKLNLLGNNNPDIGTSVCYKNIGLIYFTKDDYTKALEYYEKSLTIQVKLFGSEDYSTAGTYGNIGLAYMKLAKFNSALDYFHKSLSVRFKFFQEKNKDISVDYRNIGELYYAKHDLDSALGYYQKSIISLVKDFNDTSCYSNPKLSNVLSETELLSTLYLKAKTLNELSLKNGGIAPPSSQINLEASLSACSLASNLADKMRTGYKAEGSKLILGEKSHKVFNLAIEVSLKLYEKTKNEQFKDQAFYFAEKSKAAVLKENLSEVNAELFSKIPNNLLEKEKQLKIDLAFYETQLQKELQKKDTADSSKIDKYRNQLFDLNTKYQNLIANFEKNYPDYYNLKYQTNTVSVKDVQNNLPGNTALLDYFSGDSTIYIFTVTKDDFNVSSIKKGNAFPQLVKDFYSSIVKVDNSEYINAANKLSELLIKPVLPQISSKENLVIIPQEDLFKVPFEALLTQKENQEQANFSSLNYLIKTFNISYHYSASLYLSKLGEKQKTIDQGQRDNFIGFAPVFSDSDEKNITLSAQQLAIASIDSESTFRSISVDGKKFNELKYSEWEVKSIETLFSKAENNGSDIGYFHSSATEESFKKNIKNYKIIHIATHSFVNESQPELSAIVFAQPKDSSSHEDGILYADETYNLDLNADLVVLSSCESGLGKLIKGEGMMALTRGLLYAGASNIIYSLWKIPDKQTSELMIDFYKQMLSGKSYSESLRKAKLKLISDPISARPRSWASFLLIGKD